MKQIHIWLKAFRLRTLPLSLSSVLLGSFLAYYYHAFDYKVSVLAIITTVFLQILSNLANDYGDSIKGTDNNNRVGPLRAVQSGNISIPAMKTALWVFVLLSFISGIALIYFGTKGMSINTAYFFLLLGIGAIIAAIKYTIGKRPYGYIGLGDVFVFIFFGLTGVLGTFFLNAHSINWQIVLPASSIGFLSVGVLNINNMRDVDNDSKSGKITIPVRIGRRKSRAYHVFLIVTAIVCGLIYSALNYNSVFQFIYLITLPMLWLNIKKVLTFENPVNLDPELRRLALITLFFSLTFGIGLIL